jgi:hypothetical protein
VALVAAAAAVLGATTAVLHTTQHHPFWNRTTNAWVNAAELKPGDQLKTDDGATAEVVAVHNFTGEKDMRDLTVADVHTYYVLTAGQPILVHNTSPCDTLVSDGKAETATVTPKKLLDDAQALHDTFGPPTSRAHKGATVATGQLGGELVYSVSSNGTNSKLRDLAAKLGYRRVYETDITRDVHSDAEQILFNAVDEGDYVGDGIIASSRRACGPERQNCAGRADGYAGVQLWQRTNS